MARQAMESTMLIFTVTEHTTLDMCRRIQRLASAKYPGYKFEMAESTKDYVILIHIIDRPLEREIDRITGMIKYMTQLEISLNLSYEDTEH